MHRIRLTKRKRVGIRPGTILLLFVSIRTPANVPNIGYTYVLCMDWVTFGISPNNVYCTEAGGIPCIRRIQRGGQSTRGKAQRQSQYSMITSQTPLKYDREQNHFGHCTTHREFSASGWVCISAFLRLCMMDIPSCRN